MNKKYLTKSFWQEITSVEIEKETKHCVWINGRKQNKHSEYEVFHDSFALAKSYLMGICDKKIRRAQSELDSAKAAKAKINNMTHYE